MNTVKTRKQIAIEYGISTKTLWRWLKRENIQIPKGNITPKYQKIIYDTFGKPNTNV